MTLLSSRRMSYAATVATSASAAPRITAPPQGPAPRKARRVRPLTETSLPSCRDAWDIAEEQQREADQSRRELEIAAGDVDRLTVDELATDFNDIRIRGDTSVGNALQATVFTSILIRLVRRRLGDSEHLSRERILKGSLVEKHSSANNFQADRGRPKAFISYSRKDGDFAEELVLALNENGIDAYLDKKDIAPGEPWKERLGQLILSADVVVFVLSPDSVVSPICAWEIEESERLGKRLVPLVWRTVEDGSVPARLSRLNFIFAPTGSDFSSAMTSLVAAIETDFSWLRELTRLSELAAQWEESGKLESTLIRGDRLAAAEEWLRLVPGTWTGSLRLLQQYLGDSRQYYDAIRVKFCRPLLRWKIKQYDPSRKAPNCV